MQQPLSILQDSIYDYSEANICPYSLSFHPVYPLGSRPLICLILNAICLIAQHQEANGITLVREDIYLAKVSGMGSGSADLSMPSQPVPMSPSHPPT